MTDSGPIERSVLSDQVKNHLLQGILTGQYAPGARIVETRVARELGVSQAPVREALRDLEALGVVEINAFRGARVRHPSAAELLEAYAIRAELESMAARLAVPLLTEADLDELRDCLREMRAAAGRGDAHASAVADVRFHGLIVEKSGNRTLERVWRHLEPLSRTYITVVLPGADLRLIADLHAPILAALEHHDRAEADATFHEHFERASRSFVGSWVDEPAPDGRGRAVAPTEAPDATVPLRLGAGVGRLSQGAQLRRL